MESEVGELARIKEIQRDMMDLAKRVYEVSQKYGGIYVTATCCQDSKHSWVSYSLLGEVEIKNVDYFSQKEKRNKQKII